MQNIIINNINIILYSNNDTLIREIRAILHLFFYPYNQIITIGDFHNNNINIMLCINFILDMNFII